MDQFAPLIIVTQMLSKFITFAHVTQMTLDNMAIVFCPNLFIPPPALPLIRSIQDTPHFLSLTKLLLEVL